MVFTGVFEVTEKVLIALSHWLVLTSFYEADWWHFTDPSNTGLSIKAITIILVALFIPTILFQLKRFVFGKKIHFIALFVIKVFLAVLLFLSSLPILLYYPWIRTLMLAVGISFSPFLLITTFSDRSFQKSLRRRFNCIESCLNRKPLKSEIDRLRIVSMSRDSYSEAILLVAVLLSMLIRWSFATINIFYECWQASLVLLITLASISFVSSFQGRTTRWTMKKSFESASTRTQLMTTVDIGKAPNIKSDLVVDQDSQLDQSSLHHRNSMVKLGNFGDDDNGDDVDDDDTMSSESHSQTTFDKYFSHSNRSRKYSRIALLFLASVVQGFALGMLLVFFLWIFSTPNLLVRWSGRNPETYGTLVIAFLAVGIIASMCLKGILCASIHCSSKNMATRKFKSQQVRKQFVYISQFFFIVKNAEP